MSVMPTNPCRGDWHHPFKIIGHTEAIDGTFFRGLVQMIFGLPKILPPALPYNFAANNPSFATKPRILCRFAAKDASFAAIQVTSRSRPAITIADNHFPYSYRRESLAQLRMIIIFYNFAICTKTFTDGNSTNFRSADQS